MSLRARLDKLEPAAIAAWRGGWERLAQTMRDNTPGCVNARLEQAFDEHRTELDALQASPPKPSHNAAEILGNLWGVNLHGLDLYAFEAWFNASDLPDPDRPDLNYTPAAIRTPPSEPPGAWEALEVLLPAPGKRGEAAAVVLYLLATARAVRECQP